MEYTSISGKTLQQSIESEMSGGLERLLLAIGESEHSRRTRPARQMLPLTSALFSVKCVNSIPAFFAELLYKSMKVTLVTTCDRVSVSAVKLTRARDVARAAEPTSPP